eukprot:PhF_6_TR40369/c0_g1_i4/m.60092
MDVFSSSWKQVSDALNELCDIVLCKVTVPGGESTKMKNCKNQMAWYQIVYKMCISNQMGSSGTQETGSQKVHALLRDWLEKNLQEKVTVQLQSLKTDQRLLYSISNVYADYKIVRKWVGIVFSYVEQQASTMQSNTGNSSVKLDPVDKLMLKAFHEAVYKKVALQLTGLINEHITRYRALEDVGLDILENVIRFIIDVGGSVAVTH